MDEAGHQAIEELQKDLQPVKEVFRQGTLYSLKEQKDGKDASSLGSSSSHSRYSEENFELKDV